MSEKINSSSSLVDEDTHIFMQQHSTCVLEPPDIFLDSHIMDMKFSPTANVLALGQVTGEVRVYSYSEQETKE